MKRSSFAFASLLFLVGVTQALSLGRVDPYPRLFAAAGGTLGAVITPDKQGATARVFSLTADGKQRDLQTFRLLNLPCTVMVMDHEAVAGYLVTLDDWEQLEGAHSLVIYDDTGKVIADFDSSVLIPEKPKPDAPGMSIVTWRTGATVTCAPTGVSLEGPNLRITPKSGKAVTIRIKTGKILTTP